MDLIDFTVNLKLPNGLTVKSIDYKSETGDLYLEMDNNGEPARLHLTNVEALEVQDGQAMVKLAGNMLPIAQFVDVQANNAVAESEPAPTDDVSDSPDSSDQAGCVKPEDVITADDLLEMIPNQYHSGPDLMGRYYDVTIDADASNISLENFDYDKFLEKIQIESEDDDHVAHHYYIEVKTEDGVPVEVNSGKDFVRLPQHDYYYTETDEDHSGIEVHFLIDQGGL